MSTRNILVHQYVSESADLWPSDLGVGVDDRRWQVVGRLADDLQVSLDCVFRHQDQVRVSVECTDVTLAAIHCFEDIRDPEVGIATHRATASTRAVSATGRRRS